VAQTRKLRGSRRELAVIFSDGWKTANEAARAIGRPTGSIFGVLRRMHAEGLLESDSETDPPTRGTQYRLSETATVLLAEALADESGVGVLEPGQRVLLVSYRKGFRRAAAVIASSDAAGLIAWGAELSDGWLLVLSEEVDTFRAQRLLASLEAAGCKCSHSPVDAVLAGAPLRERSERVLARD